MVSQFPCMHINYNVSYICIIQIILTRIYNAYTSLYLIIIIIIVIIAVRERVVIGIIQYILTMVKLIEGLDINDGIWTILAGVIVELLAKEDKDVVEGATWEIGKSCDYVLKD